MYIINSFRALAVILLAAILIIKEVPFKALFKDAMIQFYLALACMLFLLLVDNIFGFILSICLLSLYFRIYTSELKNKKVSGDGCKCDGSGSSGNKENCSCSGSSGSIASEADSKCSGDKCELNMAHLDTNKHAKLEGAAGAASAQMMTLNSATGETLVPYITEENLLAAQSNIVNPVEYNKELNDVDKSVYGSQGLDTKNIHIRGYDTNSEHLGTLTFAIV
jgi:Ca2+/Na+ antiporter